MLTDEQVEAAVAALSHPERFEGAEQRLASLAPQLQRILGQALWEGGWFDSAHESQLQQAAGAEDEGDRLTLIRTLLAEETRMAMLVGVAVGLELAHELKTDTEKGD